MSPCRQHGFIKKYKNIWAHYSLNPFGAFFAAILSQINKLHYTDQTNKQTNRYMNLSPLLFRHSLFFQVLHVHRPVPKINLQEVTHYSMIFNLRFKYSMRSFLWLIRTQAKLKCCRFAQRIVLNMTLVSQFTR